LIDSCGEEATVCVTVTVGAGEAVEVGEGEAVEVGAGVASVVGAGVGAGEVCGSLPTETNFTLYPTDSVASDSPGDTGKTESGESEGIHYRPPKMRIAPIIASTERKTRTARKKREVSGETSESEICNIVLVLALEVVMYIRVRESPW
jgi:hypothetical protein